jgi:hypothetical protein
MEAVMRARSFLHVSIGILALAAAYHLGARSAGAQAGYGIEAAASYDVPGFAYEPKLAVINRIVWELGGSGPRQAVPEPIPGTARAIAVGVRGVVLENGEVWSHDSGAWQLQGVFPVGPTPTQSESWGSVKARYRGERGIGQPAPLDR